jgi:DNA (cytosine-5)-methyltransferase 1
LSIKTYGSLFAGVGGIDIGLDANDLECLFQVEIDENCLQTLSHHWPDVPKFKDIKDVSGYDLPPVDIITFGSPCQDLSVAGKRAGLDGDRSSLFHEAVRIIKEMREKTNGQYPKWAMWENVVGALSSNGGADFGQVLYEMDEAGACFSEWAVLDAQYFGVPQRRRRVYMLSVFDPAIASRCPNKILPVKESSAGDSKKSVKQGKKATTEIADCLRSGGEGGRPSSRGENLIVEDSDNLNSFRMLSMTEYAEDDKSSTLKSRDYKSATDLIIENHPILLDGTRVNDVRTYTDGITPCLTNRMGTGGNTIPMVMDDRVTSEVVGTLNARDFKGVGNQYVQENKLIIESDENIIGFSHTQGLDPQASSVAFPTLRAEGGGHAVQTPQRVRRLTPIECERLMGWPDNHTLYRADGKTNSDSSRYRMCGNGVASPVVKWIIEKIKEI